MNQTYSKLPQHDSTPHRRAMRLVKFGILLSILCLVTIRAYAAPTALPEVLLDALALTQADNSAVTSWGGQTATGSPIYRLNQTPGGQPAVEFGGSDYFSAVTVPASAAQDFIIAAVIKPTGVDSYHPVVSSSSFKPGLWIDPQNRYEGNDSIGFGTNPDIGSGTGGWDIVIVDSAFGDLYVNGSLVQSDMNVASYPTAKAVSFFQSGTQHFTGMVAELRIYNDRADFGGDFTELHDALYNKYFVVPTVCAACSFSGSFSAVEARPDSAEPWTSPQIIAANTPAFGQLLYDPDLKSIELLARTKLQAGLSFREAFSPYSTTPNSFNDVVRQLDVSAGVTPENTLAVQYSSLITDTGSTSGMIGTTPYTAATTVNDLVDIAVDNLEQARDLYAYLLVFAPNAAFRADATYSAALCANTEDPYPEDPTNTAQVLDPVIDWCDFSARLRQAAREGANIRMIYGQEFKVDALGVNFSGNTAGGNAFVIQEIAKLRAAKYQFEQAEASLSSALTRAVGNGCLVSDFFTQTEWSLLSRAAEAQGNLQYLIASRLSYLGVGTQAESQADAQANFRTSAIDQYMKLIGIAGIAGAPAQTRAAGDCAVGERPDGQLVADMAANILETQRQSREMAAGRNVFGFDVTMTPARLYKTVTSREAEGSACGLSEGSRGLWDQANCAAELALSNQIYAEDKARDFDKTQSDLTAAIEGVRDGVQDRVKAVSACEEGSDAALIACVDGQIAAMNACLALVAGADDAAFNNCMNSVEAGSGHEGLDALRIIFLEHEAIELQATNIVLRIKASNDANKTVTDWLYKSGVAQSVSDAAQAALDGVTCIDHDATALISSTAGCAVVGAINVAAVSTAGALSTDADVAIANAENDAETTNLLIDQTELLIEARAADQAFFAMKGTVEGMIDDLAADLRETLRQRAWAEASPANDPSHRIVRDSARLALANEIEAAARLAYLAARRAEYEFAVALPTASGFRISDIYRARNAQDIQSFLSKLANVTSNLSGDQPTDIQPEIVEFSIAKDVLLLTDDLMRQALIDGGNATPSQVQISAERTRQFRLAAANNINPDSGRLEFEFATSLVEGGLFSNRITDFELNWLHKLGGINHGVSININTDQPNITSRAVTLEQSGMTHVRSEAGCIFDYRLVRPDALLGFVLPSGVNPEAKKVSFTANVNERLPYTNAGLMTSGLAARPISAMGWVVSINPQDANQATLDLTQLNDVEMIFRLTRHTDAVTPDPTKCVRSDW